MSPRRPISYSCLLLSVLLALPQVAHGYALNGYTWPDGSQIVMHLGLSHSPNSIQDGTGSWNGSAADALSIWNQYISTVQFVAGDAISPAPQDGANSASFSNTVYGQAWGANVLAVTLRISSQGTNFTETDVIFNNKLKWSSYRGPLIGSGTTGTYDFHRVALHEFGHVLGLDHPDEHGQSIVAIMNSIISNLDHLADDDIAGVQSLYGLKITSSLNPPSGRSGDQFSYQITATGSPTSYSATGLPPGFQLDTASGVISGQCPSSGRFFVNIVAQGMKGSATGTVQILIDPLPLTSALYFPNVLLGQNFSYQITAGNSPVTFVATGLPQGLTFDSNTGTITGVPTVSGSFSVLVKAIGANSEAAGNLWINIPAPQITSYSYPTAIELGEPFSYQITANYNPTSFAATGLPAGVNFDSSTGSISGTPTEAGFFSVLLTAHTAFGDAASYLYISIRAPRITSIGPWFVDIGGVFSLQITASNHPTSYSATGLPAGIHLDQNTGVISGVAELSGHYDIQLNAYGPTGLATEATYLEVKPLTIPTDPLTKVAGASGDTMLADPIRPRLYVTDGISLQVIDTVTFQVTRVSLVGSSAWWTDMAISADGSKLYLLGYNAKKLVSIDLNSLTVLPDLPVAVQPTRVRVGSDGRLYLTGNTSDPGVFQVDPTTGATLAHFGPMIGSNYYPCMIEMGADRNTIYVADTWSEWSLSQYQISPGSAPVLLQKVKVAANDCFMERIVVSPNGLTVGVISEGPNSFVPNPLAMRSCTNLNSVQSTFTLPSQYGQTGFNINGTLFFEAAFPDTGVTFLDSASQTVTRTISIPPTYMIVYSLATEKDNTKLFVMIGPGSGGGQVYVYQLQPPQPPPTPAHSLLNVSTRLRTQTGDNVLIGGFIISGSESKRVIIRATGPSLPVTGNLPDPTLELHNPDGSVLTNDNWNQHRADVVASGFAPANEHEAAIVATLQPGVYTAILRGLADTSGVALVELYDLTPNSDSKITNISTRGKVETNDNVMIAGFIIGGDQPTKVIVRALGPSLAGSNVPSVLNDTTLELHDSNGTAIAFNDDWQSDQAQEISDTSKAPPDPREAALLRTLQPGVYTAIVRGKSNSTGVALVEVYNLEN